MLKTMKLLLITPLFSLILAIDHVQWVHTDSTSVRPGSQVENYIKINDYLVKNADSSDVTTNMAKAIQWLDSIEEKNNDGNGLVEALKQFTALNSITSDINSCNERGYLILLSNDRAIGDSSSDRAAINRVATIVEQCSLLHAQTCQQVYPPKVQFKLDQMNKENIRRVETFLKFIIQRIRTRKIFYAPSQTEVINTGIYKQIIMSKPNLNDEEIARDAYDALINLAKDNPEHDCLNDEEARDCFEALAKSYLFEPCEYYVRELGPDVFVPAGYDIEKLDKNNTKVDGTKSKQGFYLAWARFRICEIIEDDEIQESLIDDMMNSM